MPIYEYRCEKCGVVEVMQRITEAPLKKCPKCKSKVERMISPTSFVLKGSGWYATDYAKKGSSAPAESGNGSSNGGTSTDSSPSKSESPAKSEKSSAKSTTTAEKPAAKSTD
jgi:putative FmdB family regulatory protein